MIQLYQLCLRRFVKKRAPCRVIDIGCGYGINFPVLGEQGIVVGLDLSLETLRAIKDRPALGLVQARAEALPFKAGTFDIVAMLAVIEHIERDDLALREAHRVGQPGALLIILTSAFMVLWSHHDRANRHFRRYRAETIDRLLASTGWRRLITSYVNAAVFPGSVLLRLLQRFFPPSDTYDMGPDISPIHHLLKMLLGLESWMVIKAGLRLPFGVDLINVSKREDKIL